MVMDIFAKLFGKILGKGELIANKNGIMVFKEVANDGMIKFQSYKNFKPFKTVTKKVIGDMTDGVHLYTDTTHVFTNVKNFANKSETNIVSTKYHVKNDVTKWSVYSPEPLVSDVQSIKTLQNGKQIKHRVMNNLNSIELLKESINGKKSVTLYDKKHNGKLGSRSFTIPYSHKTITSRFLNNLYKD